MDWWLQVGLTNALLATALAGVTTLATRRWTSPALAHVLWLLVVARLLAPPVFGLPIPFLRAAEAPANSLPPAVDAVVMPIGDEAGPHPAEVPPTAGAAEPLVQPTATWSRLLAGIWLGGSLVFLVSLARGVWRFRRFLARAEPAEEALQRRVAALAADVGVRRPPRVLVAGGRFPPTLWGPGREALVVLPTDFLAQLDRAEIDTVLAHELAHLARGDRWVRLLEVAALALYWWHPVAWLAVRRLRAAEELCCDGWVAQHLPAQTKSYAQCLLAAVEFLAPPRVSVPLPGVGMSAPSVALVQRRIAMILTRRCDHRLTNRARLALLCAAALALPLTLSAAAPPAGADVDPVQKAALVEAAMNTLRACEAAYEVGTIDIGQVQIWSRRWRDAESLGATPDERRQATERHLERMNRLLHKVAALHSLGLKGGESEKFHACQYFVAEAQMLLSQAE